MKKVPDITKEAAKKLRKNQTQSEKIIWDILRAKRQGLKFQRQFCLYVFSEDSGQDRYIIPDFYCSEKKLIIEIDGSIHDRKDIYELDRYKEKLLGKQGYSILRIQNKEILYNFEESLNKIKSFIRLLQPLSLEKRENSRESLGLREDKNSGKSLGLREEDDKDLGKSLRSRFIMINESFACENCGKEVTKHPSGSARNHCPFCLYSKHLDEASPGDRLSECHGIMKPVGKDYRKNKGWMVVHECTICGKKIPNKLAEDDSLEVFAKL